MSLIHCPSHQLHKSLITLLTVSSYPSTRSQLSGKQSGKNIHICHEIWMVKAQ